MSNDNVDKDEKKLSTKIEILEAMFERESYGLLDLQMMMEKVKAMKGSEKMVREIKEKMTDWSCRRHVAAVFLWDGQA
ncbi:hypothetical protein V6N11_054079 [Hibiscus sabdariffa]|uniref:Uncharacterized protein n=1 Tax=Hibiscus sabdariffa TaxID=183260 RepID=A0ABR2S2S8_9ROSI